MKQYLKQGFYPVIFLFFFLSAKAQAPAYNQNSARSNHPKMLSPGFDFQMTPQYGVGLKGKATDSLFFRGNGPGFKMDAGFSFGNFGVGISSGFISSQTDKTKINEFLAKAGVPPDQIQISTGNQQNMYLLLGPSAVFGKKIQAAIHAKGGMFINNGGFVNISKRGAQNAVYRNEPSSKSIYPGFSTGLNINYQVSDLISIGFGTDYLSTKSEVVNYDIRRSGGAVSAEGIKLSKNISSIMSGISVRYNIKSPKDAASGQASGKTYQPGKPVYGNMISSKDIATGQASGKRVLPTVNKREIAIDEPGVHRTLSSRDVATGQSSGKKYQPGQPQYGNKTINESCGPVTIRKTNADGSEEEMIFACPDDAATYNERTADFSERPTWSTSNPKKSYAVPHVFEQKGTISGRATWTSSNPGIGIVSNRTFRGGGLILHSQTSSTRTTPSTSFGTMVRMSAREAGSGMATGRRQYEPVFDEGQGEVCNPCLVTVSNPVYKDGMSGAQSNPMYENKTKISEPGDCNDGDVGIANLKVLLVNDLTGQVVATTTTEKCGDFFFANVPYGDYVIQLSGMISGKKGYDFYMKSKAEVEGQVVWGGESVNLILFDNEEIEEPAMRAGISTSRSNIRNKSITIIDADTDGDGAFETFRAIAAFSDGSTRDITEDAAASRVNKVDAFTIKQKAFNKMHRLTRGKTSSSLQLTGITFSNGENNSFKASATYSDGSAFDITNAVDITSSGTAVKQYTIVVGDLDDDGNADAVLRVTKTSSNIQNNRIISGNEEDDQELGVVKTKTKSNQSNDRVTAGGGVWNPQSNLLTHAIVIGDLDGDGKAEAAINTSHSNIKNLRIVSADTDGDGVPEAAINTSHSNIKNLLVSVGDVDGDGMSEMIVGGLVPGGAVITAALRSPGDPIPGLDVKFTKKSGGNEKNISTDENGKIKFIGPDMEPDTYQLTVNTDIYIQDETRVTVRGWDPVKKESIEEGQSNSNTRAQDHNSSRSNKTASIIANDQNDNNTKAQDHNSSRSNKTASVKWVAPETMKAAINNTKSNIKNLVATLDEIEQILNADQTSAKSIVNTSRSNIKSQRAAITDLEQILNTVETMDKKVAMAEINSKMAAMNMQFLALQKSLDAAGKQYTTVSNVLKTKHDTVKNSVGNIR